MLRDPVLQERGRAGRTAQADEAASPRDPGPTIAPPPASPIPRGAKLRVVGDVHGDLRAFRAAVATDRFIVQLGDLSDHGPDSAGVIALMLEVIEQRRGLFILGNHDRKLGRALSGMGVRMDPPLRTTLDQIDPDLRARALAALQAAPAWAMQRGRGFVHGGFHPRMLDEAPPPPLGRVSPLLSRALFGETTGRMQRDGYPERLLGWVNRIPPGFTLYCGHDQRSTDGRPYVRRGAAGGTAVFLDTGAGKGGHLSWIDLDPEPA